MNAKFTPGPWSMAESKNTLGDFVCNIHQSDGAEYTPHYSDVATTITGEKESIQKANAHLIACAPDMYEMLESACSELYGLINEVNKERLSKVHSQTETPPDLHDMETCHLIQQLLKRARGK